MIAIIIGLTVEKFQQASFINDAYSKFGSQSAPWLLLQIVNPEAS